MIPRNRRGVGLVAAALFVAGCGCAASPERKSEGAPAENDPTRRDAWGASFVLADAWSGGPNDAGGFEYTDGELALLVGRHALEPEQTLDSFLEERQRALDEPAASGFERGEQRIGNARVLTLRGHATSEGGGVELRLLVARLGPREGLSLLLIGDASSQGRIEAAWGRIMTTLRLP